MLFRVRHYGTRACPEICPSSLRILEMINLFYQKGKGFAGFEGNVMVVAGKPVFWTAFVLML